jgi:hypothetical protein
VAGPKSTNLLVRLLRKNGPASVQRFRVNRLPGLQRKIMVLNKLGEIVVTRYQFISCRSKSEGNESW